MILTRHLAIWLQHAITHKVALWRGRTLRRVLVTPEMHRVHHSVIRAEHDSNYGFALSVWDRTFRTCRAQVRARRTGGGAGMAGRETGETGGEPLAAVSLTDIAAQAAARHLQVLGGFACQDDPTLPAGTRTLLMLGPLEPGYWAAVTTSPEWGGSDPVDRWSRRVVGGLACDLGAKALFPFGGPPYLPFFTWALRTGFVWESPVKLLVHGQQGLMVSFRGALALKQALDLPAPPHRPCDTCAQPCLSACPAGALTGTGYDVPRCHGFLDSDHGQGCMTGGCLVRSTCPVSQAYARMPEQSAYHMRQFHR